MSIVFEGKIRKAEHDGKHWWARSGENSLMGGQHESTEE
jgi:hypothetical protein